MQYIVLIKISCFQQVQPERTVCDQEEDQNSAHDTPGKWNPPLMEKEHDKVQAGRIHHAAPMERNYIFVPCVLL